MVREYTTWNTDMGNVLSEDRVQHFHDQGFLPPIPVLSAAEVTYFRNRLASFEARFPEARRKLKSKSHLLCPWVEEIARHRGILDVYEDLIGPNILCYSMAFRIKEPDARTHAGWHQDGAYNPVKPILVIGALALGPCTREHGCLRVIPGTHRGGVLPHTDTGDTDSILSRGQYIEEGFDESRAVDLELAPGELGLFDAGIIHSSPVNVSRERRIVLLVEMMPTEVEPRAHRDSAMLVRGVDDFQRVNVDPSPQHELGAAELEAWRTATEGTGRNVFNGSPLAPTDVYGGGPAPKRASGTV